MYLSPDDARSDFFLAAAVYVIGPILIALILGFVPSALISGLPGALLLDIAVPILTMAALPLYLLRYREGTLAPLRSGGVSGLMAGLAVAAPVVIAAAVVEFVTGGLAGGIAVGPLAVLAVAVRWGSVAVLAVFLWLRAEYAFRPVSESQQTLVRRAGLVTVGTLGVSTVLLLLAVRSLPALLAPVVAAGIAAVFLLAERRFPQSGAGERWWVWAPLVALALGPLRILQLLLDGRAFVAGAQRAAVVVVFGLVVVMSMHNRRGATVAFGAAIGFGLAAVVGLVGGAQPIDLTAMGRGAP